MLLWACAGQRVGRLYPPFALFKHNDREPSARHLPRLTTTAGLWRSTTTGVAVCLVPAMFVKNVKSRSQPIGRGKTSGWGWRVRARPAHHSAVLWSADHLDSIRGDREPWLTLPYPTCAPFISHAHARARPCPTIIFCDLGRACARGGGGRNAQGCLKVLEWGCTLLHRSATRTPPH